MKMKGNFISLISVIFILLVGMAMTGCAIHDYVVDASYSANKGQYDAALKFAKQRIEENPSDARGWYWLGIAYYFKGNYDETIPALKKVIALKSLDDQLQSSYKFLGWAYYRKGNYEEAIRYLTMSLELKPNEADALQGRGWAFYRKGNYDEAIRNLDKAIELKPADSGALGFRGNAYYFKGNYSEAIRDLSKVIELKPSDGDAFRFRGWSYYFKSNYDEAIRDLNKAIENTKQNDKVALMDALRGKAFSYLGLGDKETAVNLIKQAKSASDYDNNYDLSRIYYAMGDKEKAWEYRGGKGMVGIEAKDYKKGSNIGAEVVKPMAGGPAEKAGILAGDVVIRLDDKDVAGLMDFVTKARTLVPGTTAKIKVLREGIEKEIPVKVAFADFIMESDPTIASIMGKKKDEFRVSELREPTSLSIAKSDVDELPSIKAKPNKNAYAIVIGIEQYRQKLPKADFAVADAQTMTEYLIKVMGFPEENVVTLINDRALKSDMEKYFEKWLWNNVEKDSTVFIYYSGHGAPNPKTGDAFLVPYDGDPSFIDQTGYSLERLYDSLGKLQAKEIVVALDSCFSGAGGRSVLAKGARPLVMNMNNSAIPSKVVVLSAASGEQISSTYDEKGHGLFTYFMLKGLKGEAETNGSVEIGNLFEYIKPQVERIARKSYNNEQTPLLIAPKELTGMKLR